ncbi:MAG TPA: hypothetical protein ENF87_01295 [Thermoproteales archaeon]|nr:hypothetical protein [Thermoproteales archaeon]
MYSEDVKNLIIDLYDNGPILMSKLGEEKRPIVEEAEKQGLVKIRKMNIREVIYLTIKGLQEVEKIKGIEHEVNVEEEISKLTQMEIKLLLRLLEGFKPVRKLLEEIGTRKYSPLQKLEQKGLIKSFKNRRRTLNYRIISLTVPGWIVAKKLAER